MDYTLESTQKEIKAKLHEKALRVTFTKVNGDKRTMFCTLNGNSIPQSTEVSSSPRKSSPSTSLAVYDLEKQEWRSFRWESVIEVTE